MCGRRLLRGSSQQQRHLERFQLRGRDADQPRLRQLRGEQIGQPGKGHIRFAAEGSVRNTRWPASLRGGDAAPPQGGLTGASFARYGKHGRRCPVIGGKLAHPTPFGRAHDAAHGSHSHISPQPPREREKRMTTQLINAMTR